MPSQGLGLGGGVDDSLLNSWLNLPAKMDAGSERLDYDATREQKGDNLAWIRVVAPRRRITQ